MYFIHVYHLDLLLYITRINLLGVGVGGGGSFMICLSIFNLHVHVAL